MKKLCIYFKSEESGSLIDIGPYDGICLRARKNRYKLKKNCLKGGRCKKWSEVIQEPAPKKQRRFYELSF